jgi:shikimate dehydrogenase
MSSIDVNTQLCGVIGNPVKHSLSPAMHNAAYEAQDLNFVYLAFEVEDVRACIDGMRSMPNFRGLSVTIPHKLTVMEHLDELTRMAQKVGSVNTITNENGKLVGHSTDGLGTLRAFQEADVELKGKRILIVGAGGAVRSVAFALADEAEVEELTIVARTPSKAMPLVSDLKTHTSCRKINFGHLIDDLSDAVDEHDIIIQGTPVGMAPDYEGQSPIPENLLKPNHVVFDMVYKPLQTELLKDANAAGCKTIVGTEMLLHQATLQHEIWTGQPAPLDAMRSALMKHV